MKKILIKEASLINEGVVTEGDILLRGDRIERVGGTIDIQADQTIDAHGNICMPGIIDDQVHFREPGMSYKADIFSESRAAVAGGITSFMEMPNTKPPALTQQLLKDKYDIAAKHAWANYSFFMGASNENIEEVLKTNQRDICGLKIFMGSSTGNMLVDDRKVLEALFSRVPMLIATHCEDEQTIRGNLQKMIAEKGRENLVPSDHPIIRNDEGCYLSSSMAVEMAKKYNTRLHILHISTAIELALFDNSMPLEQKRITSEVCVHHLHFDASDYAMLGNLIKCNPAIKESGNKEALFEALLDNRLDIIATDHAPHTWEEKERIYADAPSGLPLVQHALNLMLGFYHRGKISLERIVEKMCHAPAICFDVEDRGYLREGYFADVIIVDPDARWEVGPTNIHYKCGWSPLQGVPVFGKVLHTFVNGEEVYSAEDGHKKPEGRRLLFARN